MASSARARPSATSSRQNRAPQLPPYQPLQHPLNESAQRALQNLSRDHKLDSLKTRLKSTNNHLTHAAVDVNERLQMKNAQYEKQKKRLEKLGSQEDNERDGMITNARNQADEMTAKLEASVRATIDSSAEVEHVERALRELQENVIEGRGRIVPTQSTLGASQNRSHWIQRKGSDDDENDLSANEPMEENSPTVVFKQKIADQHSAYQAMSMAKRCV